MPRVHSAVAAKDYPNQGIQKGERYFYWTPFRAGKRMSKTPPTPSQVESNPTRAEYLALQEGLAIDIEQAESIEDIIAILENATSEFEGIVYGLREKADNIEDGFGHETEMSMQFNEQADEVENWISELANPDLPQEPDSEPVKPERKNFPDGESGDDQFDEATSDWLNEFEDWQDAQDSWEASVEEVREEAQSLLDDAPEI
mgnify:FL=1